MSSRKVVIDGVTYVRSRDAARSVNLALDYISCLARAGVIAGRRVQGLCSSISTPCTPSPVPPSTISTHFTGEKDETHLPAPLAPDRWQFWMQTSCYPAEEGLHGFAMETAVTQIAARGYYLFTGSARLLATRVVARAATPQVPIIATGTDASSTAQ